MGRDAWRRKCRDRCLSSVCRSDLKKETTHGFIGKGCLFHWTIFFGHESITLVENCGKVTGKMKDKRGKRGGLIKLVLTPVDALLHPSKVHFPIADSLQPWYVKPALLLIPPCTPVQGWSPKTPDSISLSYKSSCSIPLPLCKTFQTAKAAFSRQTVYWFPYSPRFAQWHSRSTTAAFSDLASTRLGLLSFRWSEIEANPNRVPLRLSNITGPGVSI